MKSVKFLLSLSFLFLLLASCQPTTNEPAAKADTINNQVEANIKMYTGVWDTIMNQGKLELFNENNFTKDVLFHSAPQNIVGIDSARAYYANYLTGFSKIEFKINDVFGQGDKIVKHWTFKGVHTGVFFAIPATNKPVTVEGATLVKMREGKIAEEQDFFDNLEFMQQLGLIPRQ